MTRLDGGAKRGDEIKCYVFVTNVNKVVGEIKIDKRDRSNSKMKMLLVYNRLRLSIYNPAESCKPSAAASEIPGQAPILILARDTSSRILLVRCIPLEKNKHYNLM